MKTIRGGDIKAIRQYSNLEAVEMAQAAGVELEEYMSWERDKATPTFNQLMAFLDVSRINKQAYFKKVFSHSESSLFNFFKLVELKIEQG